MKLKIESMKDNVLLGRKEIEFKVVGFEATPSRHEIEKKIASQLKANVDNVYVDHLYQIFGKREAVGTAKVYEKPIEKPRKTKSASEEKPAGETQEAAAKESEAEEKKAEAPEKKEEDA